MTSQCKFEQLNLQYEHIGPFWWKPCPVSKVHSSCWISSELNVRLDSEAGYRKKVDLLVYVTNYVILNQSMIVSHESIWTWGFWCIQWSFDMSESKINKRHREKIIGIFPVVVKLRYCILGFWQFIPHCMHLLH